LGWYTNGRVWGTNMAIACGRGSGGGAGGAGKASGSEELKSVGGDGAAGPTAVELPRRFVLKDANVAAPAARVGPLADG